MDKLIGEFNPGSGINKAVFVWDEEGSGIIIGLVKRMIGESVAGSRSTSYFGEDYEPGYFVQKDEQWLYAVKSTLEGTDYQLVPIESVRLQS